MNKKSWYVKIYKEYLLNKDKKASRISMIKKLVEIVCVRAHAFIIFLELDNFWYFNLIDFKSMSTHV